MRIAAAALVLLGLSRSAQAEDTVLLVGLNGVGEIWQDGAISQVYRSSRFAGSATLSWRLSDLLSADGEVSYLRMGAGEASLQLVPLALHATARIERDRVEVFGGLGPALVSFVEEHPSGTITGTKIGTDIRAGTRIATNLVQPRLYPETSVQRLDVELFLGRRIHHAFGIGSGLDLSAWRAGAGVTLRL